MFFRRILKKIGFLILFISALYTTVASLTNMTLFDAIESFAAENETQFIHPFDLQERKLQLVNRKLAYKLNRSTYVSTEEIEGPKTLEETIDFSKYQKKRVVATGYTAGVESTGKTSNHPQYGITYSGVKVKRDLYSTIAADLSVFPLGTILYIPDYGYGVVADIGGAIKGNKIDLYFETVQDVYNEWGKREVDVYIIEKGDGKITNEQLVSLNENEALQVFREQIINKNKE